MGFGQFTETRNHVAIPNEMAAAMTGRPAAEGVHHFEVYLATDIVGEPLCLMQGVKDGEWHGESFLLKGAPEPVEVVVAAERLGEVKMGLIQRRPIVCTANGETTCYINGPTRTLAQKTQAMRELAVMEKEVSDWADSPEGIAAMEEQEQERILTPEKLRAGIDVLLNGTHEAHPATKDKHGNWFMHMNCQADLDRLSKAMGRPIVVSWYHGGHGASHWMVDDHNG